MPRLNVAHTNGRKQENNKERFQGKWKEHRPSLEQSVLVVEAWNVRTLLDRSGSDRPERRTALVGKELSRYGIDIAALSETLQMRDRWRKVAVVTPSFGLVNRQTNQELQESVLQSEAQCSQNSRAFQKASMNDS